MMPAHTLNHGTPYQPAHILFVLVSNYLEYWVFTSSTKLFMDCL